MISSRRRPMSKLSDLASQRLGTYALSATSDRKVAAACGMHPGTCHHGTVRWVPIVGAALGTMALAQPAEARIIYTPTNVQITDGFFYIHFIPNGPYEAGFRQRCVDSCTLYAFGGAGGAIQAMNRASYSYAEALNGGATVGPKARFGSDVNDRMAMSIDGHGDGYWFYTGARYLGVRFQVNGKTHYGWARLVNSSPHGATLTGYAYETIPGKAIKAGYRKDGSNDLTDEPNGTPDDSALLPLEPGSLGMLALGAQAIPVMEGKEKR